MDNKLLSSGQIKACKIKKKWVIHKKEVDKFIKTYYN